MTDNKRVLEIIDRIGQRILENKDYLTELDNVIGDGDHGINMARGFKEVSAKMQALGDKDIGTILKTVGMTLVSTVGGASGPLYGTAFMRSGIALGAKYQVDSSDFMLILDNAIDGIAQRGRAVKGEKTILDSLIPARDSFKLEYEKTMDFALSLKKAVEAADEGVEFTKTIIATKGRASYLGERSIGHQDPGATSAALMLRVVMECCI